MVVQIGVAAIDEVAVAAIIGHAGLDLAGDNHGADALLRRNLVDRHAAWRLEADCAGMTASRQPLHEEGHILWRDAELALEHAAGPQRRRLHVFRHADALALEISRARDL